MQAASKAAMPCARASDHASQHIAGAARPASQGGALAAMVARPSGAATTVSGPLSNTLAAGTLGGYPDAFELRAMWMLVADVAEQPGKFSLVRGEDNL